MNEMSKSSPLRHASRRLWQFLGALAEQARRDRVDIRASGLAYSSILATVPLVAVLFALFSAFAAFDELKQRVLDLLFEQLLPTRQQEIVGFIDGFIDNTQSLGFVGFMTLMVTAILLLDGIESNFNDIWHVRRRRGFVSKITTYTSVLVFGTVLIGVSVLMSARLKTLLFTGTMLDRPWLTTVGSWLFSPLASFLTFLWMFLIIPTTRVRLRSAAVGALGTTIAWELGKNLFALSVGESVRYSTIYGSLATIPIFLIWTYVTWIIVLVGLEVVYTHQNFAALRRLRASAGKPQYRQRLSLAVRLFAVVAERYDSRKPPIIYEDLADRLVAPLPIVEDLVAVLKAEGLVREVTEDNVVGLVPAASLERISVWEVVRSFVGEPWSSAVDDSPIDHAVHGLMDEFEAAGRSLMAEVSFRAFLDELPAAQIQD
jgi:membrane protein